MGVMESGIPMPQSGLPLEVPEPIEFETTEKVSRVLYGAVTGEGEGEVVTPENFLEQLAERLSEKSGGGGDGGAGARYVKEIKRSKWIVAILALVIGPGGMIGTYYALKYQTNTNTSEIERIKKADKAEAPRIEKNEKEIQLIKVNVSGINDSMVAIADGVESLKQKNVTRLERELEKSEKELEKAERELRRRDRNP